MGENVPVTFFAVEIAVLCVDWRLLRYRIEMLCYINHTVSQDLTMVITTAKGIKEDSVLVV